MRWLLRDDPRLRHWGRAFAIASLVHVLLPDFEQEGWGGPATLEVVGALWLLWRPSAGAFLLCAASTAWPLLLLRDVLTQSMYLTWCAAIGAWASARGRPRFALDAVRWLTAGVYLLAALHKLNTEWLNPEFSCANHAWAQVAGRWSLGTPGWLADVLPLLTIALEVAIGLAVLFRSPWMWPLGVAFHVPLTVTLAPAFGAVMLAGYVAATPARAMVRWRRALRARPGWILAGGLVAGGLDIGFTGGVPDLEALFKVVVAGALLAWSSLALGRPRWTRLEAAWGPKWVALAWLLHGLTPYFGVQYQHAAAMLSNLRIDAGCHNSLVFPEWLRGADPYLRVEAASLGGDHARRERVLRETLWSLPALHAMHRNWCIPENRPIRLEGTWRSEPFSIVDLCEVGWLDGLPTAARWVPSGLQRYQKNLLRECPTACIH